MSLEIRKLFLRFSHTSVFNSHYLILFVLSLCKYFFPSSLDIQLLHPPPLPPVNIKHDI